MARVPPGLRAPSSGAFSVTPQRHGGSRSPPPPPQIHPLVLSGGVLYKEHWTRGQKFCFISALPLASTVPLPIHLSFLATLHDL